MASCKVTFAPLDKTVRVDEGTTLLEAAGHAGIVINNVCGGDGICGRCKMIVRKGKVRSDPTSLLTREEIQRGVVLSCQSFVESNLLVEIPEETRAADSIQAFQEAPRFQAIHPGTAAREFPHAPLVTRTFLQIREPTLENNLADCQRLQSAVSKATDISRMQMGLRVLRRLPGILRKNAFSVTATIGWRRDIAEIMDVEGGDSSNTNYLAVVDVGTSTVVVHLVDAVCMKTVGADACFNSQSIYGRDVTSRIMAAEKRGAEQLQRILVRDINRLIQRLVRKHKVALRHVTGVVCAGNTSMMHFLIGLPTENIRRAPYVASSVDPPPFRAAEVGIGINPRGLLYCIPGISAWVGGDLTAGILATGIHKMKKTAMLIDVGTNGEIVLGNREWLIACSASTGPALEGASVERGMMAEKGAIEKVYLENGQVKFKTIEGVAPRGICGSGIIDLVAVLLEKGIIDRSGKLVEGSDPAVSFEKKGGVYTLAKARGRRKALYITQADIDNIVTAKAAVFAAIRILLDRTELGFGDISKLFLAGGFGSYVDRAKAVRIGLLPDLPVSAIQYVGNTSIWGAKLAALSREADNELREIRRMTTYYDLMGAADYVEQFQRAMFLPHTDIELFPSAKGQA